MNKTFQKGEILCREGVFESWMYEIVKGQVAVYTRYGTEEVQKLAVLKEGYVGEMGVIEARPRTATVVAEEETEVVCISDEQFRTYFTEHPEKIKEIMVILVKRLDEMNDLYMEALQTVREYMKVYGENQTMSETLKNAVKKFSEIFRKRATLVAACVMLSAAAAAVAPAMTTTAYANSGSGIDTMAGYSVQDTSMTMYVASGCNVREAPTIDSRIVNGLAQGTKIEVTGIVRCYGVDAGWRQVFIKDATYGGETTAYIAASLLTPSAPSVPSTPAAPAVNPGSSVVPASGMRYITATAGANIRATADLNGFVVGHTYYADAVNVLGYSGEWTKVSVNGVTGYIHSTLLGVSRPAAASSTGQTGNASSINNNTNYAAKSVYTVNVSSGYLALRSAKSYDSSNEMLQLYPGSAVEVLEGSGTYWTVRPVGTNIVGYVNSNYLA